MKTRRTKIMRSAPTFEEALYRVKLKAKPLDKKTKLELILPKIRKVFVKVLESQVNRKPES